MIEYMENGDKKYTCDLCKRKYGVLNGRSYNGGFCKIKIRHEMDVGSTCFDAIERFVEFRRDHSKK